MPARQTDDSSTFLMGKIDGKLDGVLTAVAQLHASFTAHAASDEANFQSIREEAAANNAKNAKLMGVFTAILALISMIAPKLIDVVFK